MKRIKAKHLLPLCGVVALSMPVGFSLSGCDDGYNSAEDVGEDIDDAADNAGDAIDDAADDAGDAIDDAVDDNTVDDVP